MISGLTYEGVLLRAVWLALMKLRREALAFGAPRRNSRVVRDVGRDEVACDEKE